MSAENNDTSTQRRIRPWIASLLTLLGLGLGLFYAGKTRLAIWVVAASFALSLLFAAILFGLILGTDLLWLDSFAKFHGQFQFSGLAISILAAIAVYFYVSKEPRTIDRHGKKRLFGYLAIWFLPILASAFLGFALRSFALQPFHIPAGSMRPTISVNEYLFAQKWSYGYSRYSFKPFHNLLPSGRVFNRTPERGDIVVFALPSDPGIDYIKRIVGLPGDSIKMSEGVLIINGETAKLKFLEEVNYEGRGYSGKEGEIFAETLPNGKVYKILNTHKTNQDNTAEIIVPEGHYFMLGDNRDNSQDSRFSEAMGFVPHDNLLGKVMLKSDR